MNIKDIIALARAGYKKADIDEIMQSQTDEAPGEPIPNNEDTAPTEPEPEAKKVEEQQPDYKKLYEESQENLKKAQLANINTNNEPIKTDDAKVLNDLVSSFM